MHTFAANRTNLLQTACTHLLQTACTHLRGCMLNAYLLQLYIILMYLRNSSKVRIA